MTYPLVQTHGSIPGPMLDKLGIDERLLCLFVGLENAEDLIADLEQAIGQPYRGRINHQGCVFCPGWVRPGAALCATVNGAFA